MKRISIIFLTCFFPLVIFSQKHKSLLETAISLIPDSIFSQTIYNKQIIKNVFQFSSSVSKLIESQNTDDCIVRDYNHEYFDSTIKASLSFCIDTIGYLLKIYNNMQQLQIKIFSNLEDTIIGISYNIDDEAIFIQRVIQFYKKERCRLLDYNKPIFEELNFSLDNYSSLTHDSIIKFYSNRNIEYPSKDRLIFTFTPKDDIYLVDNFFDFDDGNEYFFYIDKNQLYGHYFWRKYVLVNNKFKPIGRIKKRKKTKEPLF